jgi:glycosyltransferase involved in cell wall biosynthesis
MATPVVSVVISAYRSPYLRDAIASVHAQTFSDLEIIVVDDGSPESVQIGGCLCLRQTNQVPGAARNTGIRAAGGVYIAFLDSDDSWEPTYLAEQIAAIRKDQGFDLIYCNALMMRHPESARPTLMESTPPRDLMTWSNLLRDDVTVYLSGVVARREALLDAGLLDERCIHGEDFDPWMRLLKNDARMVFQPRVLLNRRLHPDSLSPDALNHSEKALLMLAKFRGRSDLTAERTAIEWRESRLALGAIAVLVRMLATPGARVAGRGTVHPPRPCSRPPEGLRRHTLGGWRGRVASGEHRSTAHQPRRPRRTPTAPYRGES